MNIFIIHEFMNIYYSRILIISNTALVSAFAFEQTKRLKTAESHHCKGSSSDDDDNNHSCAKQKSAVGVSYKSSGCSHSVSALLVDASVAQYFEVVWPLEWFDLWSGLVFGVVWPLEQFGLWSGLARYLF